MLTWADADADDKTFTVVDTGGFYPDPPEDIFAQAKEQALFAVDEGDITIHLLDGKEGVTPADMELSRLLRASGKRSSSASGYSMTGRLRRAYR